MQLSLKVSHRLVLSFALVVLLVGGLGYLAYVTTGWIGDRLAPLGAAAFEEVETAAELALSARASEAALQEILAERTRDAEAPAGAAMEALNAHLATFERHLGRGRELAQTRDSRAAAASLDAVEQAFVAYKQRTAELLERSATDPEAAAAFLDQEVEPRLHEALLPALARYRTVTEAAYTEQAAAADRALTWTRWLGLAAAVLAGLIVLALAFFLTRYLVRALGSLIDAARLIGAGHLDWRIEVGTRDEMGELAQAINQMVDELSSRTVSQRYVDNILESMADPLVVVDPDVRIAKVNQAALDLLGYEREELLESTVAVIFGHTGPHRGAAIKRTIEQGLAGTVETSFRTKDGTDVPVSLSSALMRESEEDVQGLVIVAQDITERKQFERELIDAKEKAEQMVHLRDAFLANMSHEIRTPLTGILGSAQVLTEVVEGEHKNLAKIIEDAGTRLLDTINSVLEMARIEAGEVQPELEVLDMTEEAEVAARVLKTLAEKKGLLLRVQAEGDPVHARLDRSCFHRVLNNLIGNAIKFTREGAVTVEVSSDADHAVLTVRDTGVGISKEFLPHLFDDFKQESSGLKRSHEGSGLGLAITRKLVEMLGGAISVESIKGIGSAFTVTFPLVPAEQAPARNPAATPKPVPKSVVAPARPRYPWETEEDVAPEEPTFTPPPPPEERTPRNVLLIEDNAQNAYMAQFMLRDFTCDIATNPDAALEQVRHNQYGVLLVDINLGADRSGIDLLREIRQIEGYAHVTAIAVTAYALPGDEERFLQEGFDGYVAKPFRKERLIETVSHALEAKPLQPADGPDLDALLGGSFGSIDDEPAGDGAATAADLTGAEASPADVPPAPTDSDAGRPRPVAG